MEIWRRYIIAMVMAMAALAVDAQELRCNVEVNSQQVEGTNKSVFEALQEGMSTYMNETKFTNATFSPIEKLDCRMFLTVKEYKDDRIKGELQVQLSRPVYNSSYTTTVFNFRDTKIDFEYREGDPLIFNENTVDNNLTALLDYYAYLFLALDFDTFSPKGGQQFYDRAQSIVQQAQSIGEVGWRTFEDSKNRAAVLNGFTETNTSSIRDLLYKYHRLGMDQMATSVDKGRAQVTESLDDIKKVADVAPMSVILSIFRDAKLDELVNIYSKAPSSEREKVYDILQPIYPTENDRLDKIKKGEER